MANEISFSGSLKFVKGTKSGSLSGSGKATQVGDDYVQGTQDVGTVEEVLVKNDIGTIGWVACENMDTNDDIQFGATTGVYSITLPPGKFFCCPWATVNVYAKSLGSGGTAKVQYLLIEL